jgi:cell division transport system ATP-binding protein
MEEHTPVDNEVVISLNNADIFQEDHLVLSGVNLEVHKGEFVYLIGKVGSGKTSLIKTINADIPLRNGEATIVGFALNKIKRNQVPFLRRKLGIVFQDFQLLIDRTVYQNLQFVLEATGWKNNKEVDAKIVDVLQKVGLQHKGYKMPHQLSGGEQQRVVIARALLNDPEVILADEPTGNLDPETSEGIMQLLNDIQQNEKAIIMATHNYPLLKKFPAKTYKCEDGKLSEIGKIQEIDFSLMD